MSVGYGLIGASKFGRFCLEKYKDIPELDPVAVWNRTSERARALSEEAGIGCSDSLNGLLSDPNVDVVHIATTPDVHARQAAAALAAGKHVLCEKPLCMTLEEADELTRKAQRNGLRLTVDFMMRFGPLWESVDTIVRERLLGSFLRGYVFNCAGDDQLTPDHWFWDPSRSGGIFVEHGVHFFDLMRSWLGPGTVTSAGRHLRPRSDVVDQVHCTVRYGDQGSVNYYHGFHQASLLDRQEVKLIFERGEVRMRGWIADSIEVLAVLDDESLDKTARLFEAPRVETIEKVCGAKRDVVRRWQKETVDRLTRIFWESGTTSVDSYRSALGKLMEDLVAAVRDPIRRLRVRGDDGRAALKLAVDATRMAEEADRT
jgi:predicted dehydrogenase